MIDSCCLIHRFAESAMVGGVTIPLLHWAEEWRVTAGHKTVLGLLDTGFDKRIPDLAGANLVIRDFTGSRECDSATAEHGTHSVTLLIGQGRDQIRGLAPAARLLVARVVGPEGVAEPEIVAQAIDWLITSGAQIVALPLGDAIEHNEIARQIEQGDQSGVLFFAAAGNGYPEALVFPARHPSAIAVGAADFRGRLLEECSRLPRLDLVAPAWKIAAPIRGRIVRRRSGSSVACVVAAGVAALALSAGAIPVSGRSRAKALAALQRSFASRAPPDP